ncbi:MULTISPECIES: ABC transporter permease [Planktothricoides]|uniref:ABC transporter permease n=2 Tax=Planktothricoides raciborskii TaxID=132608 RepID=A0AAU8J837_9CYAN|nr:MULTISPECIES: ABC transporter permease [Planktothricoides]KOR37524.1 ABC transporter permease [Planktothricoides sp. SR001]MBD2543009.1 ABC transporter permease [Planktothricoides raciborskii FACHB-1370]MBD2581888.1 ABC transporter permease [Planktothricoides raciborskii FACHB-1261]
MKKPEYHQSLKPSIFWGIAQSIPKSLHGVLIAMAVIFPLGFWWLAANLPGVDSVFLPSPLEVGQALIRLWEKGFLTQDIAASCFRVGVGFLLAAIASVPIGILMGAFASIRAIMEPIAGILRYMPAAAFIPLLILYLGIGEAPKIMLIFIGTVFYNTLMVMDAVKFVPKEMIETTYTLGGSRKQVLLEVITPYIFPSIIDTFRINIATSWNLVVVAELVAAETGLGKRILIAQKFMQTDEIFACLIVLGLIGLSLDLSFRLLLKVSCQWVS